MTLHLVQLLPDGAALARFAHARGLPDGDAGYVLHRALRDAFGNAAPQPFRLLDAPGRQARLLGYAPAGAPDLRDALALAEPDIDRVFPADGIDSKAMPARFEPGRQLGFDVRVCPLVRTKASDDPGRQREVDAFVHEARALPPDAPLAREAVYAAWLRDKLAAGGAELVAARLAGFALAPLVRRTHASPQGGGKAKDGPPRRLLAAAGRGAARRPDATFRGTLRVADPERFQALLARGVGRHRAFGFGMLLLRPA